MERAQLRIQTRAFLLSSRRAEIFQPGATETRHGQGSDAQQQGKEETEGRQEHQEGRGRALAVRVRQGGRRAVFDGKEVIASSWPGRSANGSAQSAAR